MKITYDQTFQAPLSNLGSDLVSMIKDRDYAQIADQFGYAVAFGRPLKDAIASDIAGCLNTEDRCDVISLESAPRIEVQYFKQPDSVGLFALVECFLPLDQDSGELVLELVITNKDQEYYVMLEGISYSCDLSR